LKDGLLFQVEGKRTTLLGDLTYPHSPAGSLFLIINFYETLFTIPDFPAKNVYFLEFIETFLKVLEQVHVLYIPISRSERIVNTISLLLKVEIISKWHAILSEHSTRLSSETRNLQKILAGEDTRDTVIKTNCFPVLEENFLNSTSDLGFLETLSVGILKHTGNDEFHIIPTEKKSDTELTSQITTCWIVAKKIAGGYKIKPRRGHRVYVNFDEKAGCYTGGSFGIALTLAMVEALLQYYNAPFFIDTTQGLVSSGAIDANGRVAQMDNDVVAQKLAILFYSSALFFVLPEENYSTAKTKLLELKNEYPSRNLTLIPIQNLSDLLDRRSLVEIKRQPYVKRGLRAVKKNRVASVLALIIVLIGSFLGYINYDDNPAAIFSDGAYLHINNKSGHTLWSLKYPVSDQAVFNIKPDEGMQKWILDINNDGVNEILLSQEPIAHNENDIDCIVCFSKNGNVIWRYSYIDTVYSDRETIDVFRSISIIDTLTVNDVKCIACFTNSVYSYVSPLFFLDVRTGEG